MCASLNRSLAGSISSGKVFARMQFVREHIESLSRDLNYATSPAVIQSALRVREIGEKVRNYLKSQFPKHKTGLRRKSSKVREGWIARFYSAGTQYRGVASGGGSLWGFYLEHKAEEDEHVRVILKSVEHGANPHMIWPGVDPRAKNRWLKDGQEPRKALRWGIPIKKGKEGRQVMSRGHLVGGTPSYGYLAKTQKYADALLARNGSLLEDELTRVIQKGARLRPYALGATTGAGDILEDAVSGENISSLLANAASPLDAIRSARKRRGGK